MDQKQDVSKLVSLFKAWREEVDKGGICTFHDDYIHIYKDKMEDIAPLSEWTLNEPYLPGDPNSYYHFQHNIVIDGVRFQAISLEPINSSEDLDHTPWK